MNLISSAFSDSLLLSITDFIGVLIPLWEHVLSFLSTLNQKGYFSFYFEWQKKLYLTKKRHVSLLFRMLSQFLAHFPRGSPSTLSSIPTYDAKVDSSHCSKCISSPDLHLLLSISSGSPSSSPSFHGCIHNAEHSRSRLDKKKEEDGAQKQDELQMEDYVWIILCRQG